MGDFITQVQSQKQIQIMSQTQIYSLKLLSMSTGDLREEIENRTKDNPVLQVEDKILEQSYSSIKTKNSSNLSSAGRQASDSYQAILEQKEDRREILTEHLLHQLNMERLNETEISIGEKLIYNLDPQGHHLLEPTTLLDKNNPLENIPTLEKCIKLIQTFDPIGICTKNIEESLLVQARQTSGATDLTLFILDGHLDFINPPNPEKAKKRIKSYIASRKSLFGLSEKEKKYLSIDFDETDVKNSINFIKALTPFPAARFSTSETHFISPDVYVSEVAGENLEGLDEEDLREKNILKVENHFWKIQAQNNNIPTVTIAPELQELLVSKSLKGEHEKELKEKFKSAKEFVEMLDNRNLTIKKSAWEIVKRQHKFFEMGPGNLVPFTLKNLADSIGISESTASRMANGKYLQFNGSVYPMKYFFESTFHTPKTPQDKNTGDEENEISRDKIIMEIKNIIEEHKDDKKKLSDQKICDLLAENGTKIARRTVAKYRSLLKIDSSYNR